MQNMNLGHLVAETKKTFKNYRNMLKGPRSKLKEASTGCILDNFIQKTTMTVIETHQIYFLNPWAHNDKRVTIISTSGSENCN